MIRQASAKTWPGSSFEGLWTDRADATDILDRRIRRGQIAEADRELYQSFIGLGYAIIKAAVPVEVCERIRESLAEAWIQGSDLLLMQEPGSPVATPVRPDAPPERMRILDMHAVSRNARDALFSEKLVGFLETVFEAPPLLFQSLTFERGSEQGLHQDPAYVVVSEPRKLAASWIALEDVAPGSGELRYIPRSHRLPEFLFSGEFRHWNPDRDGPDQHEEWIEYLIDTSSELELREERFTPSVGDVLIWAADLVHGGAPVDDRDLTRRSLVGHYCPRPVEPHFFEYAHDRRTVMTHGDGLYCSYHVDLSARGPDLND